MGPFKGGPDTFVIEMPSVFAFYLKFVCFFHLFISHFIFVKKTMFFSRKNDGQI